MVVAVGPVAPPEAQQPHPLIDAEEAFDEWADVLPERRRLRRAAAWLIVLLLGDPSAGSEPRGGLSGFAAPAPPWWSHRFVPAAACLVLVAASLAWANTRWSPDCRPQPFAGRVSVEVVDRECIGYSDSARHVFSGNQQQLRRIQERIFEQNAKAEAEWRNGGRRRPYVTLVYLGALTGYQTGSDEESYVSEREELEGLAVAQYALLEKDTEAYDVALLRIVVANGGRQMHHAVKAVAMLEELVRDDPTVVGVVGLVDSRTSTAKALRELNRIGLPAVATTLSADKFDDNSELYLQMSAPNADQAKMIREYAVHLKVSEVLIYYTTGLNSSRKQDRYVDTLVKALEERFGRRLLKEPAFRWDDQSLAHKTCGYGGLLVFAGRWSEFDGFLRALTECGDDPPKNLVADDSVNRYMANHHLRKTAPGNVPVTYVSKAALATCDALWAARKANNDLRDSFLRLVQKQNPLDRPRCLPNDSTPVGERVSLAYDAAIMVTDAVERLAARLRPNTQAKWDPQAVNPISVHTEMLLRAQRGFQGVTGLIRFTDDSGVPVSRRISLLKVKSVRDLASEPVEVFHCGVADSADDDARCVKP